MNKRSMVRTNDCGIERMLSKIVVFFYEFHHRAQLFFINGVQTLIHVERKRIV